MTLIMDAQSLFLCKGNTKIYDLKKKSEK